MKPSPVDILVRLKDVRPNGAGWTANVRRTRTGRTASVFTAATASGSYIATLAAAGRRSLQQSAFCPAIYSMIERGGGRCLSPKTTVQPCNHPHRLRG